MSDFDVDTVQSVPNSRNLGVISTTPSNTSPPREFGTLNESVRCESSRKPLFDSSDDDNCDSDNFGFLSTSTSTSAVPNTNFVDSYYSTVQVAPKIENASLMCTSSYGNTQKSDCDCSVAVLLPDLVISAQNSRSNKLDHGAANKGERNKMSDYVEPFKNNLNLHESSTGPVNTCEYFLFLRKSLVQIAILQRNLINRHYVAFKCKSLLSKTFFKKVSSLCFTFIVHPPTHRRSRSDRTHEIKKLNSTNQCNLFFLNFCR